MEIRYIYTCLAVCALSSVATSTWATGTNARLGVLDSQGNFIIAGETGMESSAHTLRTVKRNSSGTTVWAKDFYLSGSEGMRAVQVKADSSGNVYVLAHAFEGSYSDPDTAVLLKYTSSGTLSWSTTYPKFHAFGLALDTYDLPFVAGMETDPAITGTNGRIVRYSNSGTIQYDELLTVLDNTYIEAIQIDGSNRVFVAGITTSSSANRAFIARYTRVLGQQWVNDSLFPSGYVPITPNFPSNFQQVGLTIDSASSTAASFACQLVSQTISSPTYVRKVNASGTSVWAKTITSVNLNASAGVLADADDNIMIGGTELAPSSFTQTTGYRLMKLQGSNGSTLASSAYSLATQDSALRTTSIAQDAQDHYLMSGDYVQYSTGNQILRVPEFDQSVTLNGYWTFNATNSVIATCVLPTSVATTFYAGGNTISSGTLYPLQGKIYNGGSSSWLYYQTTTYP